MKGVYNKYLWVYINDPEKCEFVVYTRWNRGVQVHTYRTIRIINMNMILIDTHCCFELQSYI